MFQSNPAGDIDDELDRLTEWAEGIGVEVEPIHEAGRSIYISSISRNRDDPATKGNGTRVIRAIIALADQRRLATEVAFMTDEPALGAFYRELGFVVDPEQTPHLITNMTRAVSLI